jgi:hypothetical protein
MVNMVNMVNIYNILYNYFQFYIKFSLIYYMTKHKGHDYKLSAVEYYLTEDNSQEANHAYKKPKD